MRHVLEPDELEGEPPTLELDQHETYTELVEGDPAEKTRTVFPWFLLASNLLPEAFRMSLASQVPYFFQSILREAGVDFSYTEVDGTPWEPDREYNDGVVFLLRREDMEGLFRRFRRAGGFGIYDVFIQLPEDGRISYGFNERLGFENVAAERLQEEVEQFQETLRTAADGE